LNRQRDWDIKALVRERDGGEFGLADDLSYVREEGEVAT